MIDTSTTGTVLTSESPTTSARRGFIDRMRASAMQNVLLLGLVVLGLVFQLLTGVVLIPSNIRGVLLDSAVLLIVAVPASLLLIAGYVDLSVGSILGLGGVTSSVVLVQAGWPPIVAVLAGVAAGAVAGAVNATLIAVLELSPLIVTLGTLSLFFGIARGVSDLPVTGFPHSFGLLGGGLVGGIPVPVVIAFVVSVGGWMFAARMPAGRHVYALGANPSASFLSGLRVRIIPFVLYVVVGAAAAFGGIISASRLESASSGTLGVGFEITVLTALLLGGINFAGGNGSVGGVVIGVLFLGVLQNGLTLVGIPDFWQSIATGAVLVLAAGLNFINSRRLAARH